MTSEAVQEGIVVSLARAVREPPEWVLENLLPVGLTFLAAPPKAYKSTLEMGMACLVAGYQCSILPDGIGRIPKGGPEIGRAVGLSFEATAGELRWMIEEGLGVTPLRDDDSLMVFPDPYDFRIDTPDGATKFVYWLDDIHPRMVFIDPLRDLHSLDEANSGDMNRMLRPLQKWAKANHAAVLVVHHTKKPGEGFSGTQRANDMRGSSAFFGLADAILMMTPRDQMQVTLNATFKRAPGWEKVLTLGAYGAVSNTSDNESEMERRVYGLLMEQIKTAEIAKKLKVSKARVIEICQVLRRRGKVKKLDGKWTVVFNGTGASK